MQFAPTSAVIHLEASAEGVYLMMWGHEPCQTLTNLIHPCHKTDFWSDRRSLN